MSPELSMIIINYQKAIAVLTGLSIAKAIVYPHAERILQDCTYPGIVCLGLRVLNLMCCYVQCSRLFPFRTPTSQHMLKVY